MTVKELIKALKMFNPEKEVHPNDFHKGLDDIGVVKEVAEGHIEILPMSYGKNYFEHEVFAKWLITEGWYFGELMELWYQDEEEISSKGKTFDEVIKEFKNI